MWETVGLGIPGIWTEKLHHHLTIVIGWPGDISHKDHVENPTWLHIQSLWHPLVSPTDLCWPVAMV
jgi:hypothetical protein